MSDETYLCLPKQKGNLTRRILLSYIHVAPSRSHLEELGVHIYYCIPFLSWHISYMIWKDLALHGCNCNWQGKYMFNTKTKKKKLNLRKLLD